MFLLRPPSIKSTLIAKIPSHRIYIILGIVISLLIIIIALGLANSRTSSFGRASTRTQISGGAAFSPENSYLFASPISAVADGSSIIRVTAIILNNNGLGISGQQVSLKSEAGVKISTVASITDTFGRAIFDVTANTPGDYTLTAGIQGATLPQTVSVSFR